MTAAAETPQGRRGFVGLWAGISPSLVPILAVITAFLAGIPLITLTVNDNALQPDIAEGLRVSSTAYVALVESITGLTINEAASADDFAELRGYAANNQITTARSLSRQARPFERIVEVGKEETRAFAIFFERYEIDEDNASAIAERIPMIREIGADTLRGLKPTLDELDGLKHSDLGELAKLVSDETELSEDTLVQASSPFSHPGKQVRYRAKANSSGLESHRRTWPGGLAA